MADLVALLTERLTPAFASVRDAACAETGTDPASVPAPPSVRRSDRADLQADGALALAKRLGRSPRDVAAEVIATTDLGDLTASLEVAGPGFLNIDLADDVLVALARRAHADARLDVAVDPDAGVVVVDYSAPNVAKEMHVGHLRSTVIGDALVRVLEHQGHTVVRENHVGDWGTPFGMLIEHLVDVGEEKAVAELSVGDLNRFYQDARASFDADDAFKDRSRQRVVRLQSGEAETRRLWQVLVDQSTAYFQTVYDRLDVLLTPADVVGESSYNDDLATVVSDLDAAGLLVVDDGAQDHGQHQKRQGKTVHVAALGLVEVVGVFDPEVGIQLGSAVPGALTQHPPEVARSVDVPKHEHPREPVSEKVKHDRQGGDVPIPSQTPREREDLQRDADGEEEAE